jgi:hypothetical protein
MDAEAFNNFVNAKYWPHDQTERGHLIQRIGRRAAALPSSRQGARGLDCLKRLDAKGGEYHLSGRERYGSRRPYEYWIPLGAELRGRVKVVWNS